MTYVEGPLTYDVMADDTVGYLDGVVGQLRPGLSGRPGAPPVVYAKTLRMLATEPELDLAGAVPAVDGSPRGPVGDAGR